MIKLERIRGLKWDLGDTMRDRLWDFQLIHSSYSLLAFCHDFTGESIGRSLWDCLRTPLKISLRQGGQREFTFHDQA